MPPSFIAGVRSRQGPVGHMNTTTEYVDPYPFEDFAPTLSQCFVIVIIGYLLAKLEILSANDVKGVISFASYFAMPGIICISLADADFDDFRWELIFGIYLGKLIIFVAIAGFWILLNGNIGVAGTVAIFCVQSNDLPVGNPLMSSLYRDYRPQMMKYLFLIPAMTVIFFVPVSNIMISIHREKQQKSDQYKDAELKKYWWQGGHKDRYWTQIYGIAKNPVVIATVLGLVLNLVFRGNLPKPLHQPIKVAAETIPGIALAMLGFCFVRKERYLVSSAIVPASILFFLKMILTPVLLHSILKMLTEESSSSKLLSDFALLYGIISPATAVFQSGLEFRKSLAAMNVALILTSLACFPVSYIVARITIAPTHQLNSYVPLFKSILFWTACVSLFCGVVVGLAMFYWKNKWHQASSLYIRYLLLTQGIVCFGVLFWSNTERGEWSPYYEVILNYGGEISLYVWTGVLAVVLVVSEKSVLQGYKGFAIIAITAFSISTVMTTVMCFLMPHHSNQHVYMVGRVKSNFEFLQLIMTSILLLISLIVVLVCLTCHFNKERTIPKLIAKPSSFDNAVFHIEEGPAVKKNDRARKELIYEDKAFEALDEIGEANVYYEEMQKYSGRQNEESADRDWKFRLSSLLILLALTMFVRFITNVYKLAHSNALEVLMPMEFLQSTLFIGQGVLILLTFGIDIRTSIISMKKWWRKIKYGKGEISVKYGSSDSNEKESIVQFCNQFYSFYYCQCFKDIAKERRWKDTVYKDSFWGHQLVDWLISEGLCQNDVEAEGQGQKLLGGGVIQHVTQRHHFYDGPYMYHFVQKKGRYPEWEKT